MEREMGIEPTTSSLGSWRSTAELLPHADYLTACRQIGSAGLHARLLQAPDLSVCWPMSWGG